VYFTPAAAAKTNRKSTLPIVSVLLNFIKPMIDVYNELFDAQFSEFFFYDLADLGIIMMTND
jgi:hypothetical protein